MLVRDSTRIETRPWARDVEIHTGDLFVPSSLVKAVEGMDAAYYLVHSMCSGHDYADSDRRAATNFVRAGKDLQQGHLSRRVIARRPDHVRASPQSSRSGPDPSRRSSHSGGESRSHRRLRLRVLRDGPVSDRETTDPDRSELDQNEVQPIAIRDTLSYLIQALDRDITGVLEVGGERMSFRQMLEDYAEARGLKRVILLAKPILPPRLAASAVGLVTGLPEASPPPCSKGSSTPFWRIPPVPGACFPGSFPFPTGSRWISP